MGPSRSKSIACLLGVAVLAGSCHEPEKYLPISPSNNNGTPVSEILDVTAASTSIRADGGSRTRIEAHIDPASTVRTVTFTTTHGTLFAGSGTSTASTAGVPVDADSTGIAAVELRSEATPATARVTASMTVPDTNPARTVVRTIDIQFTPVSSGEVITVTASTTSAEADGATHIRIVATVAPGVLAASREVTFTATGGEFASNFVGGDKRTAKVQADSSSTAAVELIAPLQAISVGITALASNFSARTEIAFKPALPDVIFLELDKASVTRLGMDTVTVTAKLLREVGQVTNNTVVSFEARDSAGTLIGTFSEIKLAEIDTTDTSDPFKRLKATATFNPIDTAAAGVATITAKVGPRSGSVPITLD